MFRVKAYAPFVIPLGLTILLWLVALRDDIAAWDDASRLIGLFLLGFALLAISLVFSAALRDDLPAPAETRPEPTFPSVSEFRSGFSKKAPAAPVRARLRSSPNVVVPLRRDRIRLRDAVGHVPTPFVTIESLNRQLHARAQKLWSRRAS